MMETVMKMILPHRILNTVLLAVAIVAGMSSCGKKSAAEQLESAMEQTQRRLPKPMGEEFVWVGARYDRAANEILFEYTSHEPYELTEEQRAQLHGMMAGQFLPSFEKDGEQVVSLIRKLRPDIHYVYRWEGDGHIWLDDTCQADEYL